MNIAIIDAEIVGKKKHRFPNLACSISIRNGNYVDYDLSATQEKLAIRISKALKNLKELIFEYYQEQDKDWVSGVTDTNVGSKGGGEE